MTKVDLIAFGTLCMFWDHFGHTFSWTGIGILFVIFGIVGLIVDLIWKGIKQ